MSTAPSNEPCLQRLFRIGEDHKTEQGAVCDLCQQASGITGAFAGEGDRARAQLMNFRAAATIDQLLKMFRGREDELIADAMSCAHSSGVLSEVSTATSYDDM